MKYATVITDRHTGQSVECSEGDIATEFSEGSLYWWQEGNGACDCNRSAFFFRALHGLEDDAEFKEALCDDGINKRYIVPHLKLADGTLVPVDEPIELVGDVSRFA